VVVGVEVVGRVVLAGIEDEGLTGELALVEAEGLPLRAEIELLVGGPEEAAVALEAVKRFDPLGVGRRMGGQGPQFTV
jgi:hypothetical protein